jgi:aryl-alcohol dehydrogenase-like predicted oxidoreductase
MNYRRLGRTGLKVSEIGLGTWWSYGKKVEQEESVRCIRRAFDLGINFFDTADVYSEGKAEQILGEAIRSLPREQLVVATKCAGTAWAGPLGKGLSRKHVVEALHASLRRLGLDYIDLYQVHWPDAETPLDETLKAMDDLIRQGKVLYAGCSNFAAAQIEEAAKLAERYNITRFDSVQPVYSMFSRKAEADLLPYCGQQGVGVVVYSPLAQGLLTGKYRQGQALPAGSRWAERGEAGMQERYGRNAIEKVEMLICIAERAGRTLSQLALAWILRRAEVTSAIIGATNVRQVEENVPASDWRMPEDAAAEVEKVLAIPAT